MSQSSIITLLSDLGTRDASVSAAKAMLIGYIPGATIVDISHHVTQYDVQQAAYLLLSASRHFPPGSVHLALVDVFAGDTPRMLLAQKGDHFFIAPDNGLLSLAFGKESGNARLCYEFSKPCFFSDWIKHAGETIAALSQGYDKLPFKSYEIKEIIRLFQPRTVPLGIDCNILYVDHYENIVLDITKAQFEEIIKNRPFKIKMMRLPDITAISNNYSDAPEGVPLCLFNDTGFLEIAINHAPVASLLGLGPGSGSNPRYQTIRIFF